MLNVDILPRQVIVAPVLGVMTYILYTVSNGLPVPLALLAGLAVTIHMANLGLRDATFKELIAQKRVGVKDLIARCCAVVLDAIVLFGIITAAGLTLPWSIYVSLVITLVLVLPIIVVFMTRDARAPQSSQQGLALDYWVPPVFLLVSLLFVATTGAVVAPSVSQPFVSLVLLSTMMAFNRSGSRFIGLAKTVSYASIAATLVLIIANYMLIS